MKVIKGGSTFLSVEDDEMILVANKKELEVVLHALMEEGGRVARVQGDHYSSMTLDELKVFIGEVCEAKKQLK